MLLEELAEQAFGGLFVAPALDQNIKNKAVLIDGTPEPVLFPGDADDDLIEVLTIRVHAGALWGGAVPVFGADIRHRKRQLDRAHFTRRNFVRNDLRNHTMAVGTPMGDPHATWRVSTGSWPAAGIGVGG